MVRRFYPTHSDMNEAFDPFYEPTLADVPHKFIVIKVEMAKEKLSLREQRTLCKYLDKLQLKNEYWVVNKDEPYANLVKDLIFKSSPMEGDSGHKVVK